MAEISSFAETETCVELYSKVDVRDVVEREVVVVDDDNTVTCFGGATKRGEGCLETGGSIVGETGGSIVGVTELSGETGGGIVGVTELSGSCSCSRRLNFKEKM